MTIHIRSPTDPKYRKRNDNPNNKIKTRKGDTKTVVMSGCINEAIRPVFLWGVVIRKRQSNSNLRFWLCVLHGFFFKRNRYPETARDRYRCRPWSMGCD